MTISERAGLLILFGLIFTVFYAVAISVILGIRENYLRYYQKADLQWTGPRPGKRFQPVRWFWLVLAGGISSWLTVHWIILR
ncbi:MAG: hypothetical protein HY645_10775 [Acidobacteria bacterium]|nr:hypothetical protein [Acidobacteriota bacterium]